MNKTALVAATAALLWAVPSLAGPPKDPVTKCAPDAVVAGTVCMDKYEASVWRVPNPLTTNAALVKKIKKGRVTQAGLTAAGATQLGTASADYAPCTDNGQNCVNDIYAVSLPNVVPSSYITWFQSQEACANSGKRLPTSAEWQVAAIGTPDAGTDNGTTDCNTSNTGMPSNTGARSSCVSTLGAFDMVGNAYEWVADWTPLSTASPGWGGFSNDVNAVAGASTTAGPGALLRGGSWANGTGAGVFAVLGINAPSLVYPTMGFRCGR